MFSNLTSKGISKISAGVVVAVPSLALLQSAYFVTQFRHRHRDAPFPFSPSKGLVYVKSQHEDSSKFEKSRMWSWNGLKRRIMNGRARTDQEKEPLRLLVIGDSLAAGVGSLRAISPLPESIAKNLSKKLEKPVFWTCHGIPGAATSTILEQFTLMKLTDKVKTIIAMKSIDSWDDLLLFGKDFLNNRFNMTKPLPRIMQLEKRLKKDIDQDDKERETKWKQIEKSMIKSQEYDVVIVLTGVNDLKGIFLPFLQDETGSNKHTFKEELKRLLLTFSRKSESRSEVDETKSTLICLPALPTIPQVFHYPPLCWFVQSLLQMMDDEKRSLAQEFPNVLFVESPNKETINESQSSQGNDGRIIYSFTNISSKMKEGIETLMKKYVSKNEVDKDYQETESFYEASENVCLVVSSLAEYEELVALDGVHPSDFGYALWGNFIADHIAKRMLE